MEDEPPPPPPQVVQSAPAPSVQESSREALAAQLELAPQYLQLNKEQMPQYAQLLTDIEKAQAPQRAQTNLDVQKQYGPQLVEAALATVKQADPSGFAIREKLGELTLADLGIGGELTPMEERLAQQDIRSGQVSRGVGTGFGDVVGEAQYLGNQRFLREQQRRANAASFLAGATPQSSFTEVNQASRTSPVGSQDVSGFAQIAPSTNQLMGAAYQQAGLNMGATSDYNRAMQNQYQFGVQNTTNPFLTGLSAFGSFAGSVAGPAIGKWG